MAALPARLSPEARSRLQALLSRLWSLPADHPLARLHQQKLGPHRLLVLLGPKNSVGARYFQLFLVDPQGRLSRQPLALGLCNSGPFPGYNWIELTRYAGAPTFDGETVYPSVRGLDRRLF